jgi:hypothetical protein
MEQQCLLPGRMLQSLGRHDEMHIHAFRPNKEQIGIVGAFSRDKFQ